MSFTDYLENRILRHIFSMADYAPPILYVGLSRGDPLDDSSGLDEPSGDGYARVQTSVLDWDDVPSGGNEVVNIREITFPEAIDDWGAEPVTHFTIFDAAVDGDMLIYGALEVPYLVVEGSVPRFDQDMLKVTLN